MEFGGERGVFCDICTCDHLDKVLPFHCQCNNHWPWPPLPEWLGLGKAEAVPKLWHSCRAMNSAWASCLQSEMVKAKRSENPAPNLNSTHNLHLCIQVSKGMNSLRAGLGLCPAESKPALCSEIHQHCWLWVTASHSNPKVCSWGRDWWHS